MVRNIHDTSVQRRVSRIHWLSRRPVMSAAAPKAKGTVKVM
jgi:hypothetical protein